MKIVKTINGEKVPIENTHRFGSKGYYKIGDINVENSGDCYLFNCGTYYKDPDIVFDQYYKSYVLKSSNKLVEGIYDNTFKIGVFTKTPNTKIIILEDGSSAFLMDENILENNYKYRLCLENARYYHISILPTHELIKKKVIDNNIKRNLEYSLNEEHILNVEPLMNFFKITKNVSEDILKMFEKYTFGLEFETTKGMLNHIDASVLGLVPLRDGSITGLEYVTVPLKGDEVIPRIFKICETLDKFTEYDKNCALHVHIAGMPRTPEFLLAYFRIIGILQKNLFEMFSPYKHKSYGFKQKEYTKPYDYDKFNLLFDKIIKPSAVSANFNILFKYLSKFEDFSNYNYNLSNVTAHPQDVEGNRKWQINERYHFINLIPIIFTNHKTIEFRLSNATFNPDKISYFITLNLLILKFVEENITKILEEPHFIHEVFYNNDNADAIYNFLGYLNVQRLSRGMSNLIARTRDYYIQEKDKYYQFCKNNEFRKDCSTTNLRFPIINTSENIENSLDVPLNEMIQHLKAMTLEDLRNWDPNIQIHTDYQDKYTKQQIRETPISKITLDD